MDRRPLWRYPISIHAPREGGDITVTASADKRIISIHAPREGGDPNSTIYYVWQEDISIHAPREGGDALQTAPYRRSNISIHAPREGGDRLMDKYPDHECQFQSTPPARGATTR